MEHGKEPPVRALTALLFATSSILATASAEDAGTAQRSPVQLKIDDRRPTPERVLTREQIHAALVQVLKEQRIPVTSNATTILLLQLLDSEKRDEQGIQACARVRGWIEQTGKEFLPKNEVLRERCALTSQPKVAAEGGFNWLGLADALSRSSGRTDSFTSAYGETLSEVIRSLERWLPR
jgi:hypothetical protein